MSIAQMANSWLETHPKQPGCGRATAKETLIRRHNYKGEQVFMARRHWHSARAGAEASRRRLADAMREFEAQRTAEEQAELNALRAMGIGVQRRLVPERLPRSPPKSKSNGEVSSPPGYADKSRTTTGGSRMQKPNGPPRTNIATAWKSSDARSAWLSKMQSKGAAAPADLSHLVAPKTEVKPKRGGNAKASAAGFMTT